MAVSGPLVHPLLRGLLRLHLQTTTHSVEGVGSVGGAEGRGLGATKLGDDALKSMVVLEVLGDHTDEGVVNTEVCATEGDDSKHVDTEEGPEVGLGGVLGEPSLDGILEGEVESLGREVTKDVHEVTTPESGETLLSTDTSEAVHDAGVAGNLPRHDQGVSILGLDDKLHTLDGGSASLSDGARHTTGQKVDKEVGVPSHDEAV